MDKEIKTIGEYIDEVFNAYFNQQSNAEEEKEEAKNYGNINIHNTWSNSKI